MRILFEALGQLLSVLIIMGYYPSDVYAFFFAISYGTAFMCDWLLPKVQGPSFDFRSSNSSFRVRLSMRSKAFPVFFVLSFVKAPGI